ncbi:hypothetical protein DMB44_03780 [Thermoplasma sp. Kam2015]|uniref:hypothetical protein n=1 Tax=Thermoplasma sp. Kam2015 TaxID=2094122 RepID=UPI000D8C973B|nr:hypothetical protein [Thermoplasma sp. Kam2015]PYB68470.1 hypothetical protein DMB44_03780 [Thermoplasma sp. Kam2015]
MRLTNKINYLHLLRRNFNNWLSIGLYLYRGKWALPSNKKFLVVLRDHTRIKLWGLEINLLFSLLRKGIHINDALDCVINNRIPFKNEFDVEYNISIKGWCNEGNINNGNIFDVFLSEEYRFLNVFEMDVIDVGASIGDSPIYFALRGAKRVIALEPFPYSYSFAELNVKKK